MKYYGHPDFYKIVDELKKFHSRKNFQYASSKNPLGNFERCGQMVKKLFKPDINEKLAIALCYLSKQIDGVIEIVGENKKGTCDTLEDKLRDIAVYSIICIILNRQNGIKSKKVE